MHIKLELSKKEFLELIELAHVGEYIRNSVLDDSGKYDQNIHTQLTKKLYHVAFEHKFPEVQKRKLMTMDYISPTEAFDEAMQEIIETYEDEQFWHELITQLSHRDFLKTISEKEQKELDKTGWFPERLQKFIEQYDDEFEKYGVDRIEINKNASVTSDPHDFL